MVTDSGVLPGQNLLDFLYLFIHSKTLFTIMNTYNNTCLGDATTALH